jgi:hypothetical protein
MAHKIFVSYKYSDSLVYSLPEHVETTARHYVDELEKVLTEEDHIFKGEDDGEDMSTLADSTIASKLGDKIFDSTITIVLISKGMKDSTPETDQWIPWEISYSLKVQTRENANSKTNAVLAVVLPDEKGSYNYHMTYNPSCNSTTYHTSSMFQIIRDNMFNLKDKESNIRECNGSKIYNGNPSFIHSVKWEDFVNDVNRYIEIAKERRQNIDQYEITKTVK